MTREEAIKKIKWEMAGQIIDKDVRDALETLIPELRESKDDRIRKAILGLTYLDGIEPILTKCSITVGDIRGWIKKQKEQKSAEWDELQEEFRNINEAFEDGKKEVVAHPEKYGLCKSTEWSREDEQNSAFIVAALDAYNRFRKDNNNSAGQEELDRAVNWIHHRFKSLRPQPKQEWSVEDEEALRELLNILSRRELYLSDDSEWLSFKLKNWFKSLRPQWKPSEAQMNAIDYVLRYDKTGEFRDALKSLYNQLYNMYKDV